MGNNPSNIVVSDFEALPQKLEFIKKFNDIRFGDVKFLRERGKGTKILQKDYMTNSSKDFETILSGIKNRASINHPNILRVIGYTSKNDNAYCADYFKMSVFYEFYEYDLESELTLRKQKNVKTLLCVYCE